MAKSRLVSFLCSLVIAAFLLHCHADVRKVHIVYMGDKPEGDFSAKMLHHSMLESVLGSTALAKESLVHSYGRSFNGFAAKLSDDEVARIADMDGVVSVMPNHILKLHTTRSWDFMGFSEDKVGAGPEGDVVIGLIDTGVWPESESFNDLGMSPPPAKWKGTCSANFTCNNKIIGARYYNSDGYYDPSDFISPRDSEGHGTHTASTAAGNEVQGASYFGLANGTARGGAPGARIAVYKVCWYYGCSGADVLAAFDDAIADGVDILSVSLGYPVALPYLEDPIAIGSYHAMRHGILTSNSAGNGGPDPYSVSNIAPWSLTVAASTIDRKFVAQVVLGNGQIYTGLSINSFALIGNTYPLIWGGDAANYSAGANSEISSYCFPGAMNSYKVSGKIVLCDTLWDGSGILYANGIGTIMADSIFTDFAFNYPLPATKISPEDGRKILDYIRSTNYPTATILYGETWNDVAAPYVVSFSSRGPNAITPDILKPDITAPGVDILAAWSPVAPPSIYWNDKRSVKFNIISGTSMSCPHVSGAAAYVKAAHPNWSPAAVKSALMTTAYVIDSSKHEDLEFSYGSGHINPAKAVDPGLVYDASEPDYISFLCKQGYNSSTIRLITGDNSSVCNSTLLGRAWDLNYPTFSLAVEDGQQISAVFTRTVTNVGSPSSTYNVSVVYPILAEEFIPGLVSVSVQPPVLSFSAVGEKQTFTVTVKGPYIWQHKIVSGSITWRDGVHVVRSLLAIYNVLPGTLYGYFSSSSSEQSLTHEKKPKFQGNSMYHRNGILGNN